MRAIRPGPDDVLIGHPYPVPWTCFRRSLRVPGWKRILMLLPYHHGDTAQAAFLDTIIPHADLYLAITGNYWFSSAQSSIFSHWLPKMVHMDLAVDRADFPPVKREFNPPGRRRFVYIGSRSPGKNVGYLSEIARRLPGVDFHWIGMGRGGIAGLKPLGYCDFGTDESQRLVASYDFMITVGKADANPTTILEAMAWGLIPVCTKQSGYAGYEGILNVPLGDPDGAVSVLQTLQEVPDEELKRLQAVNWQALDTHFNWDRFVRQIVEAIESESSPPLGPESWQRRMRIQAAVLQSPHFLLRPRNLKRYLQAIYRGTL